MANTKQLTHTAEEVDAAITSVGELAPKVAQIDETTDVNKSFCAAGWTKGALNGEASFMEGEPSVGLDWHPYLVDFATIQSGDTTIKGKRLKDRNWLRYSEGTFAPVVGITDAMRNECMANALYKEDGTLYCAAGAYNAATFFANECRLEYVSVTDDLEQVRLGLKTRYAEVQHTKLYKDAAHTNEVTHYLMPWETTSTTLSVFVGRLDTLWLIDNEEDEFGRVWRGVFKAGADGLPIKATFHGINIAEKGKKLAPTGICPSPVTTKGDKARCFFYAYQGTDSNTTLYPSANYFNADGQSYNFYMAAQNRHYPRYSDMSQVTTMQKARKNNINAESSYPVAEGGFHALNTFLCAHEAAFGTKFLHDAGLFGSGVSSNDACSSEQTYFDFGGWRFRTYNGSAAVYPTTANTYQHVTISASNTNFRLKTSASATPAAVGGQVLMAQERPHVAVCEAQIAMSIAEEMGIGEDERFVVDGYTYYYRNVPSADSAKMNVRLYALRDVREIAAYNASNAAVTADLQFCLRVSLMDGCDLSGDVFAYFGGGCECVATMVNYKAGSAGNPVESYLEADQTQWKYVTDVEKASGQSFGFETDYDKVGECVNLQDGYVRARMGYSPYKLSNTLTMNSGFMFGECCYAYTRNEFNKTSSKVGYKTRLALRLRGAASYGICSPRLLSANHAASITANNLCGSVQVLLRE